MKQKPKELDWEKEFDKQFHTTWIRSHDSMIGLNPVYAGEKCYLVDSFKVKDFIKQTLTQQRTELLEEIKKEVNILHDKKENELHGGYDDCDYLSAYETALEDVLQNINLLNKKDE